MVLNCRVALDDLAKCLMGGCTADACRDHLRLGVKALGSLAPYFSSFDRVLRGDGKSERTLKIYHDRAASLDAWLDQLPVASCDSVPGAPDGLTVPQEPVDVTSCHIEAYIEAIAVRTSQATASHYYRALLQFFKFLMLEEAISDGPFLELAPPKVVSKPAPLIPDDALKRLLAACKGTDLEALRDTAIVMVFVDTGMRLAESVGLNHAEDALEGDVDFDYNVLHATDARGRRRAVPFGAGTRRALGRYIRQRDEFLAAPRTSTSSSREHTHRPATSKRGCQLPVAPRSTAFRMPRRWYISYARNCAPSCTSMSPQRSFSSWRCRTPAPCCSATPGTECPLRQCSGTWGGPGATNRHCESTKERRLD